MKRIFLLLLSVLFVSNIFAQDTLKAVKVQLLNAHRSIEYKSRLVVDGETVVLKNKTLTASDGNEIAALVVNGGKLTLDHCKIIKSGDGVRTSGQRGEMGHEQGRRMESRRLGRPVGMEPPADSQPKGMEPRMPEPPTDMEPRKDDFHKGDPRKDGPREGMNPRDGNRPRRPRPPGGMGGDDSFNFYGLNSAVVAVGKDSRIEMLGCEVVTDAEYANAVFSCDSASVVITDGIKIRTSKGSSRGLYATCAGSIAADGGVDIETQGAHCAALATDRGGGDVRVGVAEEPLQSSLITHGEGSPCIYSTGDIFAANAVGSAEISQTMVVEGKNTITIDDCNFSGNSPRHGGVMLYQSTSGDASVGTSILKMKNCTLKDNSKGPMFLITNTHSRVYIDNCRFLDSDGKELSSKSPLVVCKNCNEDGHRWGREGSNGGQVEITLHNQKLAGTLLANEKESSIIISHDGTTDIKEINILEGKGQVEIKK